MNDLLSTLQNATKELLKVDTGCLNTCRSKGLKGDVMAHVTTANAYASSMY